MKSKMYIINEYAYDATKTYWYGDLVSYELYGETVIFRCKCKYTNYPPNHHTAWNRYMVVNKTNIDDAVYLLEKRGVEHGYYEDDYTEYKVPEIKQLYIDTMSSYHKAIDVESKKRGHSESSRIKERWGDDLKIIGELIDDELPPQTKEALERVKSELDKYINSAGTWVDAVGKYVDLHTMVDVMLHPSK